MVAAMIRWLMALRAMVPALMAIWSGGVDGSAMSIASIALLLSLELGLDLELELEERSSNASEMQLMVMGWREGRIPVAERRVSPFFFWLFLSMGVSLSSLSLSVSLVAKMALQR